jgi:hypothetical protein
VVETLRPDEERKVHGKAMKKKSMSEDFEAALSKHILALKSKADHTSDRNMWNWKGTDLSADRCKCGFIEVKKRGETVSVMRPGGALLFKEGMSSEAQTDIKDMLAEWAGISR